MVAAESEKGKIAKTSHPKVRVRFENYLAQMFLGGPSTKIVQIILIRSKTWPPRGGAYFHLYVTKVPARFKENLAQMFLGCPFTKIVF